MTDTIVAPDLFRELVDVMFPPDPRGRLQSGAPHLHLLRAGETLVCRTHADLPDALAETLQRLALRPRGRPSAWSGEYADYAEALRGFAPLGVIHAGSLYAFPADLAPEPQAVAVTPANAEVLRGGLDEWLPDVAAGLPMTAMVEGGRAVAICASVNASPRVHCAGVETLPGHRGRGLAARATWAWAAAVRALGAEPFYATTFDNLASQSVARRLGLAAVGSEFSITCRRP